jgi:hypothetical protein
LAASHAKSIHEETLISHSMALLSQLPEARNRPSGLKERLVTVWL